MNVDVLGLVIGLLLTLFIFSYLLGDNWLYRLAVHILVGVSAAYAAVIAVDELLIPVFNRLQANPTAPASLLWLPPIILSLLLLFTWIRPVTWLGNSSVGLLVGVGAAVALVGVITGTLIPQMLSAPGDGVLWQLLVALLTISTLLYFQFTSREKDGERVRSLLHRAIAGMGHALLMITFGALFASALTTSLVLLTGRLSYFVGGVMEFVDIFVP